jgi:hypothetical protein
MSDSNEKQMSAERAHHTYSPSTLQNTEACPCYQSRDSQNARSIAGTLAHEVVEKGDDKNELSDEDAMAAAECIEFRDNRRAELQAAANAAFEKDKGGQGCANNYIVQSLQEIYLPIDDCKFEDCTATTAGYVDNAFLVRAFCYGELHDWKFGMWPVEDAEKNLQGISYALGLFKKFPWLRAVRFFFKQPHLESLTDALFTRAMVPELYLRVQTVVARARKARGLLAKGDWSMARPYVPVCNFCRHIADCPLHLENALKVAHKFVPLEFPEHIDSHDVLDPHQSSLAMQLSSVVKIWADGFRQRTTDRVLRGECCIPEGYSIAQGGGRRSIEDMEKFKKTALKYVTPEELARGADYSLTPIEEAITEKTVRGQKTKVLEAFQKELVDSGAVKPGDKFTFLRVKSEKKSSSPKKS